MRISKKERYSYVNINDNRKRLGDYDFQALAS